MRKGRSAAPLTSADPQNALAALERWAADGDRPLVVLVGAAKAGKTVLLDALAARLGRDFSVVYLARSGSDPDALSARILAALGGDVQDGTPRLVLAREIERRRADRPLVLFLDDADTLPPRVELWLFDLARRSAGALRIVLALSDARLAREFADAFRAGTEIVSIDTSLARPEAESYLRLLSMRASVPGLGSRPHRVDDGAPSRQPPAAFPPPRDERRPADVFRSPPAPVLPPLASARTFAERAPLARPAAPIPSPPKRELESRPPPSPPPAPVAPRAPAPSSEASAPQQKRGPRVRWIALALALFVGFVAGFFLSELRDAPVAALVTTPGARLAAELPSVSAPPPAPLALPEPPPAPQAARAAERAVPDPTASDAPVSDAAADPAALAARPDPFAPPVVAAALPSVDREEPAAAVADAEPPLDAIATASAATSEMAEEGAAAASAPAPDSGNDGGAVAIAADGADSLANAAADDPAPRGELPDVSAAPPSRPRLVEVRVQVEPGAEVWIGDRALGAAPVGAVSLPPGAHRLVVRLPDGREVERVVEVRGGRYEIQVR